MTYPVDRFTAIRDRFYAGKDLDSRDIGYLIDEVIRLDGLANDLDIQLHDALGTATLKTCETHSPQTPIETSVTTSTAATPSEHSST